MPRKTPGRPPVSADQLARRVEGMARFSIELPDDLLADVEASAARDERSRIAQIRVLLGEALAARKKSSREP